jgi:hypothetical protein
MTTKYIEEIIKDPRNKTYLSYQTFGSREGKRWYLDIRDLRYKKEVFKMRILDEEVEDYRCIIKEVETKRVRDKEALRLLAISNNEDKSNNEVGDGEGLSELSRGKALLEEGEGIRDIDNDIEKW